MITLAVDCRGLRTQCPLPACAGSGGCRLPLRAWGAAQRLRGPGGSPTHDALLRKRCCGICARRAGPDSSTSGPLPACAAADSDGSLGQLPGPARGWRPSDSSLRRLRQARRAGPRAGLVGGGAGAKPAICAPGGSFRALFPVLLPGPSRALFPAGSAGPLCTGLVPGSFCSSG